MRENGKEAPRSRNVSEQKESGGDIGSLGRLLGLLDLFTPSAPIWSAEALMRQTGLSRATCYRYIRALQQAKLISPVASGQFMLGARILELDRQIRLSDPLYNAAAAPARRLAASTGRTVLLCALYSDAVMCIRQERGDQDEDDSDTVSLRTRGEKRSLLHGAASKILLPYLPYHQLRNLYSRNGREIARAGLGSDWEAFLETLRGIKKAGCCVTFGEVNPGIVGVSSAILNPAGAPIGSIGLAFSQSRLRPGEMERLPEIVVAAAKSVMETLSGLKINLDFSPRGIGARGKETPVSPRREPE